MGEKTPSIYSSILIFQRWRESIRAKPTCIPAAEPSNPKSTNAMLMVQPPEDATLVLVRYYALNRILDLGIYSLAGPLSH